MPLCRFTAASACDRAVTALAWSPVHWDLFVAGYGSLDPGNPITGLICCHSLKNASRPEFQLSLPSGVLSLDFCTAAPHLLAVGCQDGSVHVVDVGMQHSCPDICSSSLLTYHHTQEVWQVKWESGAGEVLRFLSASGDGSIARWQLGPGRQLCREDLWPNFATAGDTSGAAGGERFGCCCCLDCQRMEPSMLLVGTQEGTVFKCCIDAAPGKETPFLCVSPAEPASCPPSSAAQLGLPVEGGIHKLGICQGH